MQPTIGVVFHSFNKSPICLQDRCNVVSANGSSPLENMRGLEHYLNDIMRPQADATDIKGKSIRPPINRWRPTRASGSALADSRGVRGLHRCQLRSCNRYWLGQRNNFLTTHPLTTWLDRLNVSMMTDNETSGRRTMLRQTNCFYWFYCVSSVGTKGLVVWCVRN